jgi:hypothetical protein
MYILSTVYRSTTPPRNISLTEHLTQFTSKLNTLLTATNRKKLNTYIFLDSNINLLNLNSDHSVANYHDTILNNGFIQLITRATRKQGNHFSLIDHILSNTVNTNTNSGVLVSDISDHFITFTSPSYTKISRKQAMCTARNFSKQKHIKNFKLSLRAHSWNTTYSSNYAFESFDYFWQDFYQRFNTHFPLCTFSANKNTSKIKNFLTPELLEARKQKLSLHKLFFYFIVFALGGSRPHIPFPPDLILYVNLVAMGPVHLSPVTWPQALRYWYSLTPLMHIVAQLRPIDLHNFLGQIPESSQILGASKLPLLE